MPVPTWPPPSLNEGQLQGKRTLSRRRASARPVRPYALSGRPAIVHFAWILRPMQQQQQQAESYEHGIMRLYIDRISK